MKTNSITFLILAQLSRPSGSQSCPMSGQDFETTIHPLCKHSQKLQFIHSANIPNTLSVGQVLSHGRRQWGMEQTPSLLCRARTTLGDTPLRRNKKPPLPGVHPPKESPTCSPSSSALRPSEAPSAILPSYEDTYNSLSLWFCVYILKIIYNLV